MLCAKCLRQQDAKGFSRPRIGLGGLLALQTVASIVGELHIVGMPFGFEGIIKVRRDGFKDANIEIKSSNDKSYHLADLTSPKN